MAGIKLPRWMFTVTVLVIFRVAGANHMLQGGAAVGRWVNVQDSVIQSCKGHFLCEVFPYHNSLGLTCLHARHVCDGIQHCRDGSDELPSQCDKFRGGGGGGNDIGIGIDGIGVGGGGGYEIMQDGGGPNEEIIYEDVGGPQGGPQTQVVYQDVGPRGGFGHNHLGGGAGGGGIVKTGGASHIKVGNSGYKNPKKSSSPQVIIIQQPSASKKPHTNIASLLKLMRGMGGMGGIGMGKIIARMGGMMNPFGKLGGGGLGMAGLGGGGFGRGFGGGGFGGGGFGGGGMNALRLAQILDR